MKMILQLLKNLGKPFWVTVLVGALGVGATYFFTRSSVKKDFEQRFEGWKQAFVSNYRVQPETVTVVRDSIVPVIRWKSAQPIKLSSSDSLRIAQIMNFSQVEKDSLLSVLSQRRQTDLIAYEDSLGDSIRVKSTMMFWYDPMVEESFGYFQYLNQVIYPRGGTTVIEPQIETPLCAGLFVKLGVRSEIGTWKRFTPDGTVLLPFNIGGGRQIVPQVAYDVSGKLGFAKLEIMQKVF